MVGCIGISSTGINMIEVMTRHQDEGEAMAKRQGKHTRHASPKSYIQVGIRLDQHEAERLAALSVGEETRQDTIRRLIRTSSIPHIEENPAEWAPATEELSQDYLRSLVEKDRRDD